MSDEISTELNRLSAIDIKNTTAPIKGSIGGITNGLKGMGLLNDEQAKALTVVSGALSVINGIAGFIALKTAYQEIKNHILEAESGALTAAAGVEGAFTFGLSWGKIALATSVAAATSVAILAATNNIDLGSFNLGTAEGRQSATDEVMKVV